MSDLEAVMMGAHAITDFSGIHAELGASDLVHLDGEDRSDLEDRT